MRPSQRQLLGLLLCGLILLAASFSYTPSREVNLQGDLRNRQERAPTLQPLRLIDRALGGGRGTIFVLRIQKAGSSGLAELFGLKKEYECGKNDIMDFEVPQAVDQKCNAFFMAIHYGDIVDHCLDLRGWAELLDPLPDCLSFIFSYDIQDQLQLWSTNHTKLARLYFSRSRLTGGHFAYGVHEVGHRGYYTYVTSIREPLRRVISSWNFAVRTTEDVFSSTEHELQSPELVNMTFQSFLFDESSWAGYMKSNHMVRVLCGRKAGLRTAGLRLTTDTPLRDLVEVTQEHLDCAIRHLYQDFSLVFLTEKLPEVYSLRSRIREAFNLQVTGEFGVEEGHLNRSPLDLQNGRQVSLNKLSPAQLARLKELNKYDLQLYEYAKVLHELSIKALKSF